MQLRNPIERYSFEGNEENGLESEHKRWQQQFMLKFDGKQSSSIGYLKPINKIMYIDPNSMLWKIVRLNWIYCNNFLLSGHDE